MKHTTQNIIDFLSSRKCYLAQQYSVTKIGIFGSYATGNATDESDVDIVVELSKPDLFSLIGVKQSIEEGLGVKADIVRLRERMNLVLKRKIEQDAIYV